MKVSELLPRAECQSLSDNMSAKINDKYYPYLPKYVPYERLEEVQTKFKSSVADPGCLSRIPNPIFPIPDPGLTNVPDPNLHQRILSIFDPKN
jgi:hypothetical protein